MVNRQTIWRSLTVSAGLCAAAIALLAQTAAAPDIVAGKPVVLDRVIAVISGDVLLQSDLQEEIRMSAIQPQQPPAGKSVEQEAAERLINRTLILQQMKEQHIGKEITDEELKQNLDELRKQLPACVPYRCATESGWAHFLRDHGLTPQQVDTEWRRRMQILNFVDARFRAGVRISHAEVADYYNQTFAPQFTAEHAKPPALSAVSSRIEEILLQQRVTGLLQEWLQSLRDQGGVQILDPRLNDGSPSSDDDDSGGGA